MCLLGDLMTATAVLGWNDALSLYSQAMRAAGRASGTVALHLHYLSQLAGLTAGPCQVTYAQLVGFLSRDAWAPETRKSARGAVRGFYRWAHGHGYVEVDPAEALPSVRVPQAEARPAPEEVVRWGLDRPEPRVRLMVALAAYGGLRAGEIARVHTRDVVEGRLYVLGKGGRQRVVPLAPQLLVALPGWTETGWVFPNGHGGHLSPGHVSRLVSAALPPGWTAHTLRHRLASRAYAGTRDLLAVSALLGHSRPETTQRYVRLPDDAVRAAVLAASC